MQFWVRMSIVSWASIITNSKFLKKLFFIRSHTYFTDLLFGFEIHSPEVSSKCWSLHMQNNKQSLFERSQQTSMLIYFQRKKEKKLWALFLNWLFCFNGFYSLAIEWNLIIAYREFPISISCSDLNCLDAQRYPLRMLKLASMSVTKVVITKQRPVNRQSTMTHTSEQLTMPMSCSGITAMYPNGDLQLNGTLFESEDSEWKCCR